MQESQIGKMDRIMYLYHIYGMKFHKSVRRKEGAVFLVDDPKYNEQMLIPYQQRLQASTAKKQDGKDFNAFSSEDEEDFKATRGIVTTSYQDQVSQFNTSPNVKRVIFNDRSEYSVEANHTKPFDLRMSTSEIET
jgi:hypothetical protein